MNQHQQTKSTYTNKYAFALELGFFAGLFWGTIHWIFYVFKFTKVIPAYLAEPFFKHEFLKSGAGHLVGLLVFIAFSIAVSFIYVLLFRKMKGPWPGMLYGVFWWLIIFVVVGPIFDMVKPLSALTATTVISEFCLYLLWGLFIGYTIAMEFTDERMREPKKVEG
ncbi:YqhR family membrane protein [Paenibacillus sp. FA6]|uniref:YqhR family membrane protein n=1 Tax=Paenibacillus sp. FA6 TaxID=3413029 RepID=UPI003F65882A